MATEQSAFSVGDENSAAAATDISSRDVAADTSALRRSSRGNGSNRSSWQGQSADDYAASRSYPGSIRERLPQIDQRRLNQALGWFSIGLGVAQLLAPRALGRTIGVGEHPGVMRLCGIREIASGVGLLSERAPATSAWSRVAGDAIDLALLGAALSSRDAQPRRIAVAAAAVVGVTAIDVYASQRQTRTALADASQAVPVKLSITINSPREEVYRFWRNFENLPRFMRHLRNVTVTSENTSHWVAKAPAKTTVEWDSEIVEDRPNELIAWRTLPSSEITHHGIVAFEDAPGGRGTIVRVSLQYGAPGGAIGAGIARIFGEEPRVQIKEDLQRFKQLMETGEIATTEGQPAGKRSLLGRMLIGRRFS